MTGGYLRVKREGKWENIEVEHLTNEERESILKDDDRLMSWLHLTCKELVKAEGLFKDLESEGLIQRG